MSVKITQLISYPIKSCAGISHESVVIDALGLVGDRQWMLVDSDGLFLSQRKHPTLALVQPRLTTENLILNAPGMRSLTIDLQGNHGTTEVKVWQDSLMADTFSQEVDRWFTDYLGIPVHLVHYGQQSFRQIDPDFAQQGQAVAFADGYPILVTHEASLEQLNEVLSAPIGMERFRPNIVVCSTQPAWNELQWQQLINSSGQIIQLVKPCARCVMTGVNQDTGEMTGSEVLKTLKNRFSHQNKAVFGINGMTNNSPSTPIQMRVGQRLEVK